MSTKSTILGDKKPKVSAPPQQQTQQPQFDYSLAEGTANAEAETVPSAVAYVPPAQPSTTPTTTPQTTTAPKVDPNGNVVNTGTQQAPPPQKAKITPIVGKDVQMPGIENGEIINPNKFYEEFNRNFAKPTAVDEKKKKRDEIFAAIGDGISSLSNLYFASKGAPNMYDSKSSMSGKVKERYDALQKQYDENSKWYANAAMQARKMDEETNNARAARELAKDNAKKEENRWQAQFNFTKEEADKTHQERKDALDFEKTKYNDEKGYREKQFNETVRQFNISSSQQAQHLANEAKRQAKELNEGNLSFSLGKGNGKVTIPSTSINAQTIASVFSLLPDNIKNNVHGQPMLDAYGGAIKDANDNPIFGPPTTEAMLIAIGMHSGTNVAVQDALRELSGKKTGGKGTGYSSGNGSSNNNRGY